jgi:hypothetical protein
MPMDQGGKFNGQCGGVGRRVRAIDQRHGSSLLRYGYGVTASGISRKSSCLLS